MLPLLFAEARDQPVMSALKDVAPSNAREKYTTCAVFQPLMSELKSFALWNTSSMSVTAWVFQLARFCVSVKNFCLGKAYVDWLAVAEWLCSFF